MNMINYPDKAAWLVIHTTDSYVCYDKNLADVNDVCTINVFAITDTELMKNVKGDDWYTLRINTLNSINTLYFSSIHKATACRKWLLSKMKDRKKYNEGDVFEYFEESN